MVVVYGRLCQCPVVRLSGCALGGYSHVSGTDVAGSTKFLRQFLKDKSSSDLGRTGCHRALDCGAGIGRVTKRLLLPLFQTVDMVELNQTFLDEAHKFLGDKASRVERYICSGLQEFEPEAGHYDVIWMQWVLGHLTDDDLVAFFARCKAGLRENGIICVKENITSSEKDFDTTDSSYTRSRDLLLKLFSKAGLKILKEEKQKNLPKELYGVLMFALQ